MQESCTWPVSRAYLRETLGITGSACYAYSLYGIEESRKFSRFRTRRCSERLRVSR